MSNDKFCECPQCSIARVNAFSIVMRSFARGLIVGIGSTIASAGIAFMISGYHLQAFNSCMTTWSLYYAFK